MKHYIIDGNNLIYKIKKLEKLVKSDNQNVREKLSFMIENYFIQKNVSITIYFDGYENLPIKLNKVKIIYSEKDTADNKIRLQIDAAKNKRNLVVISSDVKDIIRYAEKNGCSILASEQFAELLNSYSNRNISDEKENSGISVSEIKKIFNV